MAVPIYIHLEAVALTLSLSKGKDPCIFVFVLSSNGRYTCFDLELNLFHASPRVFGS